MTSQDMGYPLEQCEKRGSLDDVQALLNNSLNNVISTALVTNWKHPNNSSEEGLLPLSQTYPYSIHSQTDSLTMLRLYGHAFQHIIFPLRMEEFSVKFLPFSRFMVMIQIWCSGVSY